MVFNSVVFLFCFLPLSLLLYYLVPGRAKNAVLLAESLIFYCWTGIEFLPLIAALIVFNYLWALLTAKTGAKLRGLLPAVAVLVNLGVLVYFKYANFLIDTLNQIGHFGIAALNIGAVLPLGISYYIFKIISYEVDVYTGKIKPEKNFLTFAVYVLFFPQPYVGPIVKYREMADQLHDGQNRCTLAKAQRGAELFVFGLAKKVILADSIGALWTDIIGAGGVGLANVSTPLAWLGIIAYSLQLYFDFAGYSEMSNGLAALLGFVARLTSICPISPVASPNFGGAGISRFRAGSGITSTFPWAATVKARRGSFLICSWSGRLPASGMAPAGTLSPGDFTTLCC